MTAEIVIMNKMAVALAADSVVTFGPREGPKIVKTMNKLFTLSKYEPVAIMVYGNAELNEVPWETIIKNYRRQLGKRAFDHLKEYVDGFVTFLNSNNALFPESRQRRFVESAVGGYFSMIRREINKEVARVIECHHQISSSEIQGVVANKIEAHYEKVSSADRLPTVCDGYDKAIIQRYGELIDKVRAEAFGELPTSDTVTDKLTQIAGHLFSKDLFPEGTSGVVIAGFGDKEIFPSFVEFLIHGVVNDKAKYKELDHTSVGDEVSAVIKPFAQKEMVRGFMEGIERDLAELHHGYLSSMTSQYPRAVVENLPDLDENEKQVLLEKLRQFGEGMLDDLHQDREKYIRTAHVDPILSTVQSLPKVELASMAEALVELTSLKRKVSMEAETVGGPTDVAVISKGDGFIWIRRKHYFKPDLNPAFFANYFRDDEAKGAPK